MIKWPWKVVKKTDTPAEKKLEIIREILFPSLELFEAKDGQNYYVDHCVDTNLDSALTDLQENANDEVTRDTINKCIKKIIDVRHILGANDLADIKSPYRIVDMERTVIETDIGFLEEDEISS